MLSLNTCFGTLKVPDPAQTGTGLYCRAEEFRSVKFFVSIVGKADRPEGGVRLGSRLTGWKGVCCLAVNLAALLDSGLGTALALSTEVRARRRGYSTQH